MLKVKKNFTEGPIFTRILLFVIPIMLTGIIQIMYTMADNIVVGRFSGDELALAAVGSTGSLNNMIMTFVFGISGASGIVVAQFFGANNKEGVSKSVHTALFFAAILGMALSAVGLIIARPALTLMDTKPEVLDKAVLYLSIICIGIPATAIYNFGASILRAVGDSRTPLIILISTGMINVLCNLFFVILCNMSVEGVAIATVISQYLSCISVIYILMRRKDECYAFSFAKLKIDGSLLKRIMLIGIPAGVQGMMFSFSNVLISTAINTFPSTTVSANTIASNIDAITYTAMNSFQQAATTFTGQNYGAKKYKRLKKVFLFAILQVIVVGLAVGFLEIAIARPFASLYVGADDPNREVIISTAIEIISFVLTVYFLCGVMDVTAGTLRGMGYSIAPAIIAIAGICGFRIIWIYTVFPLESFNTPRGLYMSYPLSWLICIVFLFITLFAVWHRLRLRGDSTD